MTTATISLTNNTALNIIVRGNITLNVVGNGTVRVYVRGQGRDGQEGITAVLMAPVLGNGSGGAGVVAREGEGEEGGKWGTEGDREGGGGRGGGGIEKRGGVEGPGRGGMPLGLEAPTTGHSSHDDTIQGGYNDRGDDVGKDSYGHDPEYEDDDDEFRDAQLILDDTAPSSAPRFEFQIPVSNLPPPEKVTEVFHTVAPETEPRSMSITPEPSHAQQEHLHDTEMEGATPGIEAELPTRLDDNHNRRCMNMELELEHSTAQEAGPQASSRRSFPGEHKQFTNHKTTPNASQQAGELPVRVIITFLDQQIASEMWASSEASVGSVVQTWAMKHARAAPLLVCNEGAPVPMDTPVGKLARDGVACLLVSE